MSSSLEDGQVNNDFRGGWTNLQREKLDSGVLCREVFIAMSLVIDYWSAPISYKSLSFTICGPRCAWILLIFRDLYTLPLGSNLARSSMEINPTWGSGLHPIYKNKELIKFFSWKLKCLKANDFFQVFQKSEQACFLWKPGPFSKVRAISMQYPITQVPSSHLSLG